MALSDTKLRSLKPREKTYKLADGGGLIIAVSPKGRKTWKLAYRFAGKQKELTGGTYPSVGLAAARTWRDKAKAQLSEGIDPSEARKQARRQIELEDANSFEQVAREWHESRKPRWSERYAWITLRRLEADIFPEIGDVPISKLASRQILAAVRKVEDRGSIEMAKRLNSIVGEVFQYAVALQLAERDPSKDHLGALRKRIPVQHHKALPQRELPQFFERLHADPPEPMTTIALLFTIYTMVRTNETRFAVWSELENLDGKKPLWRIPAKRMKMRYEHLVPLTPTVVALLKELRALRLPGPHLFPGLRKGVMSENTMLFALYRLGYKGKATVHGFRGLASTVLNESGKFQSDWIERQLAHDERNQVRAAYNSAQYLPKRREMLEWWAQYLDNRRAEAALL
ncbi:tyrosine-type recombinase/integrase [Erythrobacter rubeus]|uniref:Integrase arm-type DNA-binding domain-containing protein n=1 Tax=Erythrobacter rubeus TaxID=2760803 RepID=A0ABR8KNK2_9SPHN|nr:integrase arm-type DNA-binding domain-containing protein [Erythrobacter rubeus]MBD2842237.1 integrase arm-type DNA-binding domain-containing protein [Erythrobacter rubeus]